MTPLAFDIFLWTTAAAGLAVVIVASNLLIKHDDLSFGDIAGWLRRPGIPSWQRLRLRLGFLRSRRGAHAKAVSA